MSEEGGAANEMCVIKQAAILDNLSLILGELKNQCTHVSKSSHTREEGAGIFHLLRSVFVEATPKKP